VKEFLSQRGVEFIEKDVTRDKGAISELQNLGISAIPVTVIDGGAVIGFRRSELEQLLAA
jgi:hypothetical protein